MKGILAELETLMNISERETAEAIISHIKVCVCLSFLVIFTTIGYSFKDV
jgi:hypothetical protein